MKRFYKISYTLYLALSIFAFSCKKLVEIDRPSDRIATDVVFSDSSNATASLLGVYSSLIGSSQLKFGNGGITVYGGLSADELYDTRGFADEQEFYNNSISVTNALVSGLWQDAYKLIYQVNACLEGLQNSTSLTQNLREQLIGEAKFLRASLYFNLVNLYGDLPLCTSINYELNAHLARVGENEVHNQVVDDLLNAILVLKTNYIGDGKVRPNRMAAIALLARVYLYQENWQQAEEYATKVISSGQYWLGPDPGNAFLPSSTEAIWQLPPLVPGVETAEGYQFIPFSNTVVPKYVVNPAIVDQFEPGDLRKTSWLSVNNINGQELYFPTKYKRNLQSGSEPLESYTLLRLAELFLVRAEARAMQDDLSGSIDDLDQIRNRAGLPLTRDLNPTITKEQLLDSIYHQRQIELFCENGHRWFDLKRTGRANEVLGAIKPDWKPSAILFPIPAIEIEANPALTQNGGY